MYALCIYYIDNRYLWLSSHAKTVSVMTRGAARDILPLVAFAKS